MDGVAVPHPPSATVADYNRLLGKSTKEGAMRTRGAKTIGRIQETGDDEWPHAPELPGLPELLALPELPHSPSSSSLE
eukprot:5972227-Pyramimonas_sp.AAC.1